MPVNYGLGFILFNEDYPNMDYADINLSDISDKETQRSDTNRLYKSDEILVYFLMPRYGQNLQSILKERGNKLPVSSVYHLGLQLINILELIHNSGLVHNDVKLDNILIGYG